MNILLPGIGDPRITLELSQVRMPSMSLNCFSCTRPLLRLYFIAYASLTPRSFSNPCLTSMRNSPAK